MDNLIHVPSFLSGRATQGMDYIAIPSFLNTASTKMYAACHTVAQCGACQVGVQTCGNCQVTCQELCEKSNQCGTCQSTCQTNCKYYCQTSCQLACQTTCQLACQTACESACQELCEKSNQCGSCQSSCQETCEKSNQCGTCQSYCQNCEGACRTTCESSCQTACKSSCQTTCQLSCQTTCQLNCQDCEGACRDACQTSSSCQSQSCSTACETSSACQDACESSCQTGLVVTEVPGDAGSLYILEKHSHSVTISFDSIENADYYQIAYREESSSTTSYLVTTKLSLTISGLTASTTYVFNYRGKNDAGSGSFKATGVTATTTAEITVEAWDWTTSNSSTIANKTASQEAVTRAYATLQGTRSARGGFDSVVWQVLVGKINDLLDAIGMAWSDTYANYSTTCGGVNKSLSAAMYNSAAYQLNRLGASISYHSKGDEILGSYITALTTSLNNLISEYNA